MAELFYRIGQAAERLGASKHTLRRLWRAGLLQGTTTESGRLMIPGSEITRLEQDGIPPLPQEMEDEDALTDEPDSQDLIDTEVQSSDAVRQSFDDVTITKNRVQKRKLDLEGEEVEDHFRAREIRANEERIAKEASDRERRSRTEAQRRQQDWEQKWHQYAIEYVTRRVSGVPADVKLEIPVHVGKVLQRMNPGQPSHVVQALVDAAIAQALKPWQLRRDIAKVVEKAVEQLPFGARSFSTPTKWQIRATNAAYQTIGQLHASASWAEIEAIARDAVEPIGQEFEHQEACDLMARRLCVNGATYHEQLEAKEFVKTALLKLPAGTPTSEMQRVIEATLAPLAHRIALREDQELRKRVTFWASFPWGFPEGDKENALQAVRQAFEQLPAGTPQRALEDQRDKAIEPFLVRHKKRELKKKLIESGLDEIFPYLLKLEQDWEFDKGTWALKDEVKNPIQQQLEKELTGDESAEDVAKRVRRLVRRELGLTKQSERSSS
jgi:hypothetical protein